MLMLTIQWQLVLELCLYGVSFLSLCLFVGLYAVKKNILPEKFLYAGGLVFVLAFHYLLFYLYTASFTLGHIVMLASILVGLSCLPLIIKDLMKNRKLMRTVWLYFFVPLLIIGTLTVTYSSLLFGCNEQDYVMDQWGQVQNPAFCHIANLPIDNALPFIYGENVLNDRARSLVIDWSIADRPPLQIGTSLPLLDLSQGSPQYMRYAYYTVFSVFLQLSWIAVVWGVLNTVLKRRLHIYGVLVALSATGFLYLNSIFVWPKLLAASLFVLGAFLMLWRYNKEKSILSYRYLPISSVAISLALLSHTGVLFTLLAMIPVVTYDVVRNKLLSVNLLKKTAVALVIAVCFLLPWQVAKSQLISHDRLIKWHFAGVIPAEDPRGTLETIVDEYQKISFDDWLKNKKANAETLITGAVVDTCSPRLNDTFDDCNMAVWRNRVFFSSFYSLELFALGFIVIAWQLWKRKLDTFDISVLVIFALYLFIWWLAMFLPTSTVLHQGSYASMLLLLLLLAKKITLLPDYTFIVFVVLQVGFFVLAWLVPFSFL